MEPPDPKLYAKEDAQLRAVPVPEGLVQRLQQVALADDEGLDAALRDVPVPPGLVPRLHGSILASDEGLDAAIREVAVPSELPGRLRRSPGNWMRLGRLTQWATAASLLIVIGLSYAGVIAAFLLATSPPHDGSPSQRDMDVAQSSGGAKRPNPTHDFLSPPYTNAEENGVFPDSLASIPPIEPRDSDGAQQRLPKEVNETLGPPDTNAPWGPPLPGRDENLLTSHDMFNDLPELEAVPGLISRGITPPPGSDIEFLFRYGVHPFVLPMASTSAESGFVPLQVDTSSYELTRRYLQRGELPPPGEVRTEEFLAAIDYGFPGSNEQALALFTAAGPSPFGGEGVCIFQVGVQADALPEVSRPSVHLVLAVDVSQSMRWEGRLMMIRRAMDKLTHRLGPEDRVSLVTFNEHAQLLLQNVHRGQMQELLDAVDSLSVEGSTNVEAGLRRAYAAARHQAALGTTATRVVLLSDGRAGLDAGAAKRIEERLAEANAEANAEGIPLDVVDLGPEREPDPQWASFARSGGGKVHQASNADQVHWALQEIITGRSQRIAAEVRLKVTFNPKTVLVYRLLGHEAEPMPPVASRQPQSDFFAGQSATAVYEICLTPGGAGGKDVAAVELSWQDPDGERQHHDLSRTVRRDHFVYSFAEAPPALQAAALVAETAEVLRESPFAAVSRNLRVRALSRVLELATQADPQLRARPCFVEFLSLVEQAEKARPYRKGARR